MLIIFTYVMRFTTDSKIIVLSAIRRRSTAFCPTHAISNRGTLLVHAFFFFSFTTAMCRRFFDKMGFTAKMVSKVLI